MLFSPKKVGVGENERTANWDSGACLMFSGGECSMCRQRFAQLDVGLSYDHAKFAIPFSVGDVSHRTPKCFPNVDSLGV